MKTNLKENEWREKLGDKAFHVMRKGGTEAPFTGVYTDSFEEGIIIAKLAERSYSNQLINSIADVAGQHSIAQRLEPLAI